MPRLNFLQRTLSWIVPVRVRAAASGQHDFLELCRYRGRWQLATEDALYSDGAAYTPLTKAFKALGASRMKNIRDVLVLGAGLGSAVWVLEAWGLRPGIVLVDWDETVLHWAIETLEEGGHADHVSAVCDDAAHFAGADEVQYGLVIVDLFRGREVPAFATSPAFLLRCAERLRADGVLVLNYIENSSGTAAPVEGALRSVFPSVRLVRHGINRIFLAGAV